MTYIVYRHLFPNGKSYVGITQQDPEKRWKNGSGYYYQPKMKRAIRKYKWRNVKHEILATGLSLEEAARLEKHYILLFDSFINGYNMTEGGEGGSLGAKHTAESREKISRSMMGNRNGDPNRYKEYQAKVGAWNSRPVDVFNTETGDKIGHFKSVRESTQAVGVNHSHVCHLLKKNPRCIFRGYEWVISEEVTA